jgi:hypothetical protein
MAIRMIILVLNNLLLTVGIIYLLRGREHGDRLHSILYHVFMQEYESKRRL